MHSEHERVKNVVFFGQWHRHTRIKKKIRVLPTGVGPMTFRLVLRNFFKTKRKLCVRFESLSKQQNCHCLGNTYTEYHNRALRPYRKTHTKFERIVVDVSYFISKIHLPLTSFPLVIGQFREDNCQFYLRLLFTTI